MGSLIFPVTLLVLLGMWGVYSTGRKFRKEFQNRGKTWGSVCASMARGEGVLVVDMLWGPQQGLGHPVIWWLPVLPEGNENLGTLLQEETSAARLVQCPRRLRNAHALKGEFGAARVKVHNWAVASALLSMESGV